MDKKNPPFNNENYIKIYIYIYIEDLYKYLK